MKKTLVSIVSGKPEFTQVHSGPFDNATVSGIPLKRKQTHQSERLVFERYQDKLYIEISLSRGYEKTHDHMRATMVLDAEQTEVLRRVIIGEPRGGLTEQVLKFESDGG